MKMEPRGGFTRWQCNEEMNLHTAVMEVMWERDEESTKGNGDEQVSSENLSLPFSLHLLKQRLKQTVVI